MSTETEQKPNGCAQGCGGLIMLFIAFAVLGMIFGDSGSNGGSSSPSRSDTPMTTMRGEVIVLDQATCAGAPMVKVHAGSRLQMPKSFSAGNAPCKLVFTMQVPSGSNQYKVQVDSLPARIFKPRDIRTPSGDYEVKMTVYGD